MKAHTTDTRIFYDPALLDVLGKERKAEFRTGHKPRNVRRINRKRGGK